MFSDIQMASARSLFGIRPVMQLGVVVYVTYNSYSQYRTNCMKTGRLIVLTALVVVDVGAASVLVGEDTPLPIMVTVLSDPENYIKTANAIHTMSTETWQ